VRTIRSHVAQFACAGALCAALLAVFLPAPARAAGGVLGTASATGSVLADGQQGFSTILSRLPVGESLSHITYGTPAFQTGAALRSRLAQVGVILSDFDPPSRKWGAGHRGIDLAARAGQTVRSPAPGTLTFAGLVAGKPVAVITHANGTRSTFEPVTASVALQSSISAGQTFGTVTPAQASHCGTAECIHWGLRDGSQYLDPWQLVSPRVTIVLLE